MVSDLNDMNAIIDQFLDFTRTEAAEPISGVNLAEMARSSAERAARSGAQVRCELDEVPVLAGDYLLLCSDGVQSLSALEIAAAAGKPVRGMIDTVLAAAKEHQDNVTVVKLERDR